MWQVKERNEKANQNLANTIEKQRILPALNNQYIKLTQSLSETKLAFEIPFHILNFWISHFKDASDILNDLCKDWSIQSVIQPQSDQDSFNSANNYLFEESCRKLNKRLKDYESIFEYYMTSTSSFSRSVEPTKFKKSTLKSRENIKFIPINLHLEQLLIEKSQIESECYEFTSVGAFTTAHTNKPTYQRPLQLLMFYDKVFQFNETSSTPQKPIYNELFLTFYSLKLLIQLGNSIKLLKEQTLNSSKGQEAMQSLKSDLDALANHVLETNQIFVDHYVQLVQIELKQTFFNLKEKLNFLQAKLRSFSIEIDNLMVKNEPDLITGLVRKLCPLLIECFSVLFTEAILDKFDFVNSCACFVQCLTTLIASIDLKFNKNSIIPSAQLTQLYDFYTRKGILFQVESMLSCMSNENLMIYEHYNAIQNLNCVYIHMPTSIQDIDSFYASFDIQNDGFHVYLYSSFESTSKPIKIYPVMFNVGINEQSMASSLLGADLMQKFINTQSILKLTSYYNYCRSEIPSSKLARMDMLFNELRTNRSLIENRRPVELLQIASEVSRCMNSIRLTNCKSGKDRTGVSVSLEQCFLLIRNHGLSESMTQQVLDDLRINGTRLDVVRKNVGQSKYAFNKLRYYLLPTLYRPPFEVCDDLET